MKQKQFFLVLVFSLLLLSSLNWITPRSIWMWKLSVLTTEYGHIFALLCLVLVFAKFVRRQPSALVASFFLAIALAGFLKPIYQLMQNETYSQIFSWKTLFFGRGLDYIEPRIISYADTNDNRQTMDYYPAQGVAHGSWILVIHGGGWDSGDFKQLPELNSYLAHKGYAVFSMNYRLVPQVKWPAQKEDVLGAITHIQKNSVEFKINPQSFAMLGRSAGAQIAAATAYSLPENKAPKAVFVFYGPTEMTFAYEVSSPDNILESRALLNSLLGGTPYSAPKVYDDASPIFYLSAKTPPTLLLYGEFDYMVWYKHGERLHERLNVLNVKNDFLSLPWATHGFDFNLNGPGGQLSTHMVDKYLTEFVLNR